MFGDAPRKQTTPSDPATLHCSETLNFSEMARDAALAAFIGDLGPTQELLDAWMATHAAPDTEEIALAAGLVRWVETSVLTPFPEVDDPMELFCIHELAQTAHILRTLTDPAVIAHEATDPAADPQRSARCVALAVQLERTALVLPTATEAIPAE